MGYKHNTNSSEKSTSKAMYYKQSSSMKRRQIISVEEESCSSRKAGEEVRDMLQRLVEIDSESRRILVKMTSLIAKDDKIESYVYRRINDPESSRMWELIVQLVGMRNDDNNLDQVIMNEEEIIESNRSINVEDGMNGEIRNNAFKVKNLLNGTESEVVVSTTKTTSTSTSTSSSSSTSTSTSSNHLKRIMLKQ